MATVTENSASTMGVEQIGEAAGLVWKTLSQHGRLSFTKLCKEVDAPRDMVLQGIGWLAREDKIEIEELARGKTISLR
ncbi:MAG: winged helix-turn-helix domain-containing protein [Pirellulales bacterium]